MRNAALFPILMPKKLQVKGLLFFIFVAISGLNVYGQPRSYIDTAGLVGWWPFTGNAIDSSGHGNNGKVSGATLTVDRFGSANSAYSFDGATNYIALGNFSGLNFFLSDFTFSVWFLNKDFANASERMIIGKDSACYTPGQFRISLQEGACFPLSYNNIGMQAEGLGIICDAHPPAPGLWNSLIIVKSASSARMYINGTLVANQPVNTSLMAEDINFDCYIGSRKATPSCRTYAGFSNFFLGCIDDVGIWKRGLSPCEVEKLYLATSSLITGNPENAIAAPGRTATFSIADTGSNATYQWQENTGRGFLNLTGKSPYSGVHTKTLTISPASPDMNGNEYRCTRNGGVCTDTSQKAILTIRTGSPATTTEDDITVLPNAADYSVAVSAAFIIEKAELTNMSGQVMFSGKNVNKNSLVIDMKNFPRGFYILKINDTYSRTIMKE